MERLQKIIANSGYCSRRKAEELIVNGEVLMNGKLVTDLGTKANSNDIIIVEGNKIESEDKEYILFYKPRGVVSTTSDDKGRKTVTSLIDTNKRLYPVGRLDYNTSGIILLTNDGELTNLLTHPKNEISKLYIAKIDDTVIPSVLKKLLSGIIVDGEKMKADRVKIRKMDKHKKTTIVEIVLHEGKYHEVKRMFEAIGYNVVSLKRETFAFLDLKGLKSGEYRHLNIKEVKKLYNLMK